MNPPTETLPFDLTGLCEKVAQRLERQQFRHPVAAAAALAARGLSGLSQADFAYESGLLASEVTQAETGETAFGELPAPIGDVLEAHPGIDLLALADLDCHGNAVHQGWKDKEEGKEKDR
jgi:hypothetical protein